MPSEYPNKTEEYENGEEEDEEDSDEEEEDEEEEVEEWNELVPLDEIDELQDGPSTYFVGGFSICKALSKAVAKTQYAQDRILVFPGTYTEAALDLTPNMSERFPIGSEQDVLVLDEARLKGLTIESVPFARATDPFVKKFTPPINSGPSHIGKADLAEHKAMRAMLEQKEPAVGRRVGPWFTYYHAAANGAFNRTATTLPAAAPTSTTTMGSSLYGSTVTPTIVDAEVFPIITSRLVLRTSDAAVGASAEEPKPDVIPLTFYKQEPDDEMEDEEGEEDNENGGDDPRRGDHGSEGGEDEDGGSSSNGGGDGGASEKPSIVIQGLCFTAGATVEPLTNSRVHHCVLGAPSILSTNAITNEILPRPRTTLLLHPLTIARVSRTIIYGGEKHAVYAYPRSSARLSSCLIDGPSLTKSMMRHTTLGRADRHMPSTLATLQAKALQRSMNEAAATTTTSSLSNAAAAASYGAGLSGGVGAESSFVTPAPGQTACEVGVFCDDADLALVDCMVSNTRLGLLLHDGCSGTKVTASDVRCAENVGIYAYGLAGAARLTQSTSRACGRECLLVFGPTEAQVAEAETNFRREHGIPDTPAKGEGEADEEENEDDEEGEVTSTHPVFAQHPAVRQCVFVGGVRLQGQVRDGACTDNFVYAPQVNATDAAASAAAATAVDASAFIQGPNFGITKAFPMRGFLFVGREGVQRKPAAADDDN